MSPKTSPADPGVPDTKPRRGRLVALIVVGAVVLVLIVAGLVWAGVRGAQLSSAKTIPGHSAVPYAPPVTGPTVSPKPTPGVTSGSGSTPKATINPKFGLPVAQTAKQGSQVDFGPGVTAKIESITATTVTAKGPGEVSGPALKVSVQITNGTSGALSLDSISVNGYYGSAKTPASPLASASVGFQGNLAAGSSARATYSFSVPANQQSSFIVTLGSGGSPVIVFTS